MGGIDGLAAAMIVAFVFVSPIGLSGAAHAISDPIAIAAIGVGISSSVIPYVFDQLAMARLARATYALFVSLLPAMALVVGVIVLRQFPSPLDVAGIALVMVGVGLHHEAPRRAKPTPRRRQSLHRQRMASDEQPVPATEHAGPRGPEARRAERPRCPRSRSDDRDDA